MHTDGSPRSSTSHTLMATGAVWSNSTMTRPGGRPSSATRRCIHHMRVIGLDVVVEVLVEPLDRPPAHGLEHRHEVLARRREVVLAAATGGRRPGLQHPAPLEVSQPLGQQRAGDPGHAAGDVVEARVAEDQLAHDQRRPPIGEHLAGQGDRTEAAVVRHARMVAPAPASWVVPNRYQRGPDLVLGAGPLPSYVRPMSILDIERSSTFTDTAASVGAEIAAFAEVHDRDGTFVDEGLRALREAGPARRRRAGRARRRGRIDPRRRPPCSASWPPLRVHRARHIHAPARGRLHRVAVPARHAGRRGHPAPGGRRGHPARLHRRRRPDPPAGRGHQGRRRLPGVGPQGVLQPVLGRYRDVDDVRLRRPRAGPPGAEHGRADRVGGRHRPRRLGHPRHAGHGQQQHHARGRLRARRAGPGQPPVRRHRPARSR